MELPRIESRIIVVRGHKVIVDSDLADLYGVPTKALNQAIKRNAERFPADFMFQLSAPEKGEVVTNCDHLHRLKFSKSLPYAFTEYGAIQAANVLNSARAVEMGLYVVRAFVRLKEAAATHAELAKRLAELEEKTDALTLNHDVFSRNTKAQLRQVFDALRELMTPPEPPKRPIGFVTHEDKKDVPKATQAATKRGRAKRP
ncbi:MAG: ORF6N domain-containing protein [Rhodoferax sp.]